VQSAADIGALGAVSTRGGANGSNASPAAFGLTCVCVLVVAAALAGFAPLWLSVATVFVFAGPHNWAELRFFITRLPVRLGRSRSFFALAAVGVVGLTVAYALLALGADSGVWGEGGWYAATALWNSAAVAWVVGLVAVRGRTMSRGGAWVWALPAGCALVGVSWLAPQGFALALVYAHPLVALWFLDRQLRLTRRGWSRVYRVCLALLPVALCVLWWRLAGAAPLAEGGEVALRIMRHAGAGVVPGVVSTHLLVSTHVFLETLHYGVWLVGVPLAAGVGVAPWRAASVPLVRHRRGRPRFIRTLLVAGGAAVLLLWLSFAADYATTRDIYFTVAMAHVLAEVPFLLRTL
jgi:hypothetical protein